MALEPPPKQANITNNAGVVQRHWFTWFTSIQQLLNPGITVTITTAALTGGGAQGSMTFQNGILVAQTQAT